MWRFGQITGKRRLRSDVASARLELFNDNRLLERFFSGKDILHLAGREPAGAGYRPLPGKVMAGWRTHVVDGAVLSFDDESLDTVYSDRVLEHIADYRRVIADWFRVIRIGGFLLIAVPHQFLFERKLSPPSRHDPAHVRFYTAASLLFEIEEALDPFAYRVRFLEDNDAAFDDRVPPERTAAGCCEILVVLQKVCRPGYADAVLADIQPKSSNADRLPVVRAANAAAGPTIVLRAASGETANIVVLKLDHRGDFILAKPAMIELRRRFPSAMLTLVCGPWNEPYAAALGIFDEILIFDFYTEDGAQLTSAQCKLAVGRFEAVMKGRRFDLAVDLRVDSDTRILLAAIDAGQRAGFDAATNVRFLDIALPIVNPTLLKLWRSVGPERFTVAGSVYSDGTIARSGWSRPSILARPLLSASGIQLEAGTYVVELDLMSVTGRFSVGVEVRASDFDRTPLWGLQRHAVQPDAPVRLSLYLQEPGAIDIRVTSWSFNLIRPFLFRGIRLARKDEWHGPHQQELMYMLACLIGLRMQSPHKQHELKA